LPGWLYRATLAGILKRLALARRITVSFVLLAALALAAPAHATFPGANGKIAFVRGGDIWTMNPDGTDQVNITNSPENELVPAWSPDGKKVAFGIGPQPGSGQIWVMNADGTGRTKLSDGSRADYDPAWSPDGTKILFGSCCRNDSGLWTMNADGTGVNAIFEGFQSAWSPDWSPAGDRMAFWEFATLCNSIDLVETAKLDFSDLFFLSPSSCTAPEFESYEPSWSPDAQRIAFGADQGPANLYSIKADGTDRRNLSGAGHPAWSPDGTKIAVGGIDKFNETGAISIENADGTGLTPITSGADSTPDWQPIPINSYPRPKGASPMVISLVPAYPACTSPDRTHGAPLAFGSCSNPQLTSQHLTVGTPDANGKRTTMEASIVLKVLGGASTDVKITSDVNNVFNKDLTDYTGGLRAQLPLQITDKDNTPSPGGPGAATVAQIPFDFDLACTATIDTTIGSDCPLSTTANALVPGSVTAGLRAIWQVGQAQVYDGGADGNPVTASDNTLFLDQGIFIP
jgi:hypothetical protein